MRVFVCLCLLIAALGRGADPAVLICSWHARDGEVDRQVLHELRAGGISVDYMDSFAEFTWDRISKFNALVLYDFPNPGENPELTPQGGRAAGPGLDAAMALVDRYLAAGGGVMITIQHTRMPESYEAARTALARFGASMPQDEVLVGPGNLRIHPRLRIPFMYTKNVHPSPVSEGVEAIWYPQPIQHGGYAYFMFAGPIGVNDDWQVVVRAPADSTVNPLIFEDLSPSKRLDNVVHLDPATKAAPLFAVREFGGGRLAYYRCWAIYHLGSGTSWLHDRAVLDRGLDRRPSNFLRLLTNTFRWLAEPSLAGDQLGGAEVDPDRLVPGPAQAKARTSLDDGVRVWRRDLAADRPVEPERIMRGIVGARTALSGGEGTVADYAAKARELGLDFVVFLEDFRELDAAELAELNAACAAASSDDLQLYAGWWATTNVGNRIFFFGRDPIYPYDSLRTGDDGRVFKLQATDTDGNWTANGDALHFVFDNLSAGGKGDLNSSGFFDFSGPMAQGGMALYHCRAFGAAGVRFYDHGKLVEDVTDQYLRTNQGTMSAVPVVVSLLDSPVAMAEAVAANQSLTCVAVAHPNQLWPFGLQWNHQYKTVKTFVSDGPWIHHWGPTIRILAYGAEDFAPLHALIPLDLLVTAEDPLAEVSLYDGERLIRRYRPDGNRFAHRFFWSGATHKNVSVVARDAAGRTAVSFPLRTWRDGSPAPVYCSDHVNDGPMRLFRGPGWQSFGWVPALPAGGTSWDGGPGPVHAALPAGYVGPTVVAGEVTQNAHPYQVPLLIAGDARLHRGRSVFTTIPPPKAPHYGPWSGFGPRQAPPLYTGQATRTLFWQYANGVDPQAWSAIGKGGGPVADLWEQDLTFVRDLTAKFIGIAGVWRAQEDDTQVLLVVGDGLELRDARVVTPRRWEVNRWASYVLPRGSWVAGLSRDVANPQIYVNRGDEPLQIRVRPDRMEVNAELPGEGRAFAKGDTYSTKILHLAWPVDEPIEDAGQLLAILRYIDAPTAWDLRRGRRRPGTVGMLDLDADDGAAEFALTASPDRRVHTSVPMYVHGMNRNWTALMLQVEGFAGQRYYSDGTNGIRELAVDEEGRIGFPVFATVAPRTHLVVGHPVVADRPAAVIQVTCLGRAAAETPLRWHVRVHNPTDETLTVALRSGFPLPDLDFAAQTVQLAPGTDRILVHSVNE